ncbi:MAG TPA: response regulator transcription factor [Methylomirabilota bacterium]|jgi:DNA-binding NarL/FixJ family response regulator|nr:response regulator transcription factor [Methylomirabilota bacterium]
MTRVFVAAPTAALRVGLRALLDGPGLEVVGDGPAPEAAPPDAEVIVVGDGALLVAAAAAIAEDGTRAVVALADDERPAGTLRGLPLRGWALVPREAPGAELRAAVMAAAQGLVVVPAALAARLLASPPGGAGAGLAGLPEALTSREREVLDLVAQGLSNRRIAERLGISEHTAKFHVGSICGKLGAASRTEAVSLAARRGLITL